MNYLDSLNEEQKKAVLATEGPVMIVAGAGAGKTKTITHRIMHLIHKGVYPDNILAITFTNKAAKEMRERVMSLIEKRVPLLVPDSKGEPFFHQRTVPFVSTFHSLGVRIIKENAELVGISRHFTIYDKTDSKKVIKDAIASIGVDPKEYTDKVMNIISGEKGRGVTYSEYAERAPYDYTSELTKKVWAKYEVQLKKEQALDFDDLLLKSLVLLKKNKEVLEKYQDKFRYIHVDEYQDTNGVQNEIIDILAKKNENICVVGDTDQCLTEKAKIRMFDGSLKSIKDVKKGEFVLSNYGSGNFRPAQIIKKQSRQFKGNLIKIETKSGKIIESTPDHTHFAGYRLELTPQIYLNYLMYKKDIGWRIGTTSIHTKGQKKSKVGFVQRSNQEHADAAWVIGTYKTQNEARVHEYILSLKYKIPTIPFTPRKGLSINGYVHDKNALKKIFSSFDTETSAKKILSDLGLSIYHPHHRPQTHNSNRRNINITLCADRRGKNPMHLISMFGNDSSGRKKLESLGFSVRSAKKNTKTWRFETSRANYGEACSLATKIASVFPELNLVFRARLGGLKKNIRDGNSLPCIPASSVMPGMALFTLDGYDIVSKISRITVPKIKVFDLDIEKTHNFIANGIITHNCIYGWRGAEIKNMLHFEKTYPQTQTIFLEQNYRSTKTILAVANNVIEKNNIRIPKKLFTENDGGEKISIFRGRNEVDEAHFIALTAKELVDGGKVKSEEIAVLYRANFQSRALEEACMAYALPYQMLGTKFFERKEIKDCVAYIQCALNSDNSTSYMRIINTPARGIGKVTLDKILEGRESELSVAVQMKINTFKEKLKNYKKILETEKPSVSIKFIITDSGIEGIYTTGKEEDTERLENCMELVTLAKRYDDLEPEEGIEKFLTDSALASDQDGLSERKDGIKLMTVHASKGLEFDYVFISGLEAGLFPHSGFGEKKKTKEESEEERRLFYVAITRARKKIYLCYAETRTIFGKTEINSPSEFLDDIPDEHSVNESYRPSAEIVGSLEPPIFRIDF